MMKYSKLVKTLMVVIMLLGVAFSIFNFVSVGLDGAGNTNTTGDWIYNDDGTKECMEPGTSCTIEADNVFKN